MALVLYCPSFNGDIRFKSVEGGKKVEVTIHDPTAAEEVAARALLAVGRERKWTTLEEIPAPKGKLKRWRKSILLLDAPISEVGAEFVKLARPSKSSITALRFSNGEMHVTEAAGTEKLLEEATASKDEGAKAASVKRPTMSCPACVPGSIEPASEVLLSFLDRQQHADWAKHRVVEVEGGITGHRYLVAHRHSPSAQRFGRITWDADDRATLHFHDISHPPEEEVLGAMLLLKHREDWVRNQASCLGGSFRHVLKNPFGDILDGTKDAALMQGLGSLLATAAVQAGEAGPEVRKLVADGLESDLQAISDGTLERQLVRGLNRIAGALGIQGGSGGVEAF